MSYDLSGKRIWVAGHRGMVGSALLRRLAREDCDILTAGREVVDLVNQTAVQDWMAEARPDAIVLAAAKVGGIKANADDPVAFLYENLMIAANILHAAHAADVQRLLVLGSSSVYPKHAPQPIREDSLLTGPLEPTHEGYALAKIAGLKLCEAYRTQFGRDWISAMPTNLYGPGDSYDPMSSHVLPALLRKFHEARNAKASLVEIWGSGTPRREFLHCDDLADALVFLLKEYSGAQQINVGSGIDVTIRELAGLIADVVGYEAELRFDATKPDGPPRKLMDSTRLRALGWNRARPLRDGIAQTYDDWLTQDAA
jgi:GDP-L-fucose synthase